MARSLGSWGLPVNTNWINEHSGWSGYRQTKKRTIGGGVAVASQALNGGRAITLEWVQGRMWLTYSDIQAIQAMLQAGPDASYTFLWDTFSTIVRLDYENQVREITQRGWRLDPSADKFYGQLFLYTTI